MKALIFEDSSSLNLSPINLLRSNYDIISGIFSFNKRFELVSNGKYEIFFHSRNYIKNYLTEKYGNCINNVIEEDILFVNGKIWMSENFIVSNIYQLTDNSVLFNDDTIIAFKVSAKKVELFNDYIINGLTECFNKKFLLDNDFDFINVPFNDEYFIYEYPWDVIKSLRFTLNSDIELFLKKYKFKNSPEKQKAYSLISPENIYISDKANILPHNVFDATAGKIIIDKNATVEPFCFLKGPIYIGEDCLVKSGTKIYGPCSLGKQSRVSGEISGTIFQGYSNKQHDGFIGNSFVAEFVNLGADTVTSNLKNNYSNIKSRNIKGKPQFNTNMQFLGSIIGDHTKTGINTMLNTGSVIGIFALLAGGGFPDKFIDSFAWYIIGKQPTNYKIDEALETAELVMSRRDIKLSDAYKDMVKYIYENS